MREIPWTELPDAELRRVAAATTIGVFDGLHRGHRALIDAICSDTSLAPVVVTFSRHPAEVLAPESFGGFIMSGEQKRETLTALGVQTVICIDFSVEFSRLSGAGFLDGLLETMDMRFAAIGYDFRCGGDMIMQSRDVENYLRERGVEVQRMHPLSDSVGPVSSTRIRTAIRNGCLREAAELLGRPYRLDLRSVQQFDRDGIIFLDQNRLFPGTGQVMPPPGNYNVAIGSTIGKAHAVLTIDHKTLTLPLAATDSIRYIDLQENRVE